ncbi:MAG: chlororespiratory reduction protein 7 [Cyanobacteria bacterium SID2]|nr:chlororespiratory reduction protein 7 [Cyanobacteria bacterium SID2]MBP0004480.1 chlororespiratory reduction protein 7 [Cyanobacteria bacterium SBC]
MGAASMYSEDHYVVLETNQPEQILTAEELFEKLKAILAQRSIEGLPRDLQNIPDLDDRVRHLIDTACDLDMNPGEFLQWYAIRLEK